MNYSAYFMTPEQRRVSETKRQRARSAGIANVPEPKPSCPIFSYHMTQDAINVASEYAEKSNCVACVFKTRSLDGVEKWAVGTQVIIKGDPKRTLGEHDETIYRNCDGAEIFPHNVAYLVYGCGSVYDTRMKVGIGPLFPRSSHPIQ